MTIETLGRTDEQIEDVVAALITGKNDVTVSYDDVNSQFSINVSTFTTEEIEDIVSALVSTGSNLSLSYDDANDNLIVSLADSISVSSVEATNTITDPSGTAHTGELADLSEGVTNFNVGSLSNGDFLQNSGGTLTGGTVSTVANVPNFELIKTFDAVSVTDPSIQISKDFDIIQILIGKNSVTDITEFQLNNDSSSSYDITLINSTDEFNKTAFDLQDQIRSYSEIIISEDGGSVGAAFETPSIDSGLLARGEQNNISGMQDLTSIDFTGTGTADMKAFGFIV
jgi:hypothetical protein